METVIVKGKYYWELIFNYDNSENPGTIEDKSIIKKKKTINSKIFLSTKFNITTQFKFENESSFSLKFDGVGDGSNKIMYSIHIDTSYELVKSSEKSETIEEETEIERTYTVGPHGKLSLYRLCYEMNGVEIKTDIVSTNPEENVFIDLNFSCIKQILGLDIILNLFGNIFPQSSNIREWKRIRDDIIKYSNKSQEEKFKKFIEILNTIVPKKDNKGEWSDIRNTCNEILIEWENIDKQLLFKKILTRFSSIYPRKHNKGEWASIRDLSNKILNGLKQI